MNTNITPEDTIAMQKAYELLKKETLPSDKAQGFASLLSLINKLRDPQSGCQWDKKQTQQSFAPCITEEANEVIKALQENNPEHLCEELGDLLFTTFFMIQLAEADNQFNLQKVLDKVLTKLVFRHPHVFGASDRSNITAEEAFQLFQEAKKLEKNSRQ
jgi:uncharacterized protein YabN with tetrapyrrole methylase and pyrophosphatase domain